MRGSSGQSSEQRRLGSPLRAFAALTALLAFLAFSSSAMASSAPTIEGVSVTGITEHDATLEAQINPNGLETTYEFHIASPACQSEWPVVGPCMAISGFPLPSTTIPAGSGDQTVRVDINSAGKTLLPGTWYEYAVTASNAAGEVTGYNAGEGPGIGRNFAGGGGEQNFKTLSATVLAPSEVVTEPAESGSNGFRLTGKLNPGNMPTNYYFEYIANNAYECLEGENCWPETAHQGPITGDSQQGVGSIEVTGLRLGETYRYRLVAENAKGIARGKILTFTVTHAYPPSVGSESVSDVTENGATLEAQVNPHGEETYRTTWVFEYGTSTAYGQSIPTPPGLFNSEACRYEEIIPCGINTPQPVSENLTGLAPATTYHYRIAATNSWGTSYGEDETFTTTPSSARSLGVADPSATNGSDQSGTSSTQTGSDGSSSVLGLTPLVSPLEKAVEPKALTKTQKLAKALKVCEKKPKGKQASCEQRAKQKYASMAEKSRRT
jgi:hypothetical protein